MSEIINLSAYQFTPLEGLPELRTRLLALCVSTGLKGTILLSPEGLNLFVAGQQTAADELMRELRLIPGLGALQPKISLSSAQPFRRMLVKIKKEIIAFGIEGLDPAGRPAPKLAPQVLKRWLDEGRPITLLDTRNDYEVKMGSFRGAVPAGIRHFRNFPDAVRKKLPASAKHSTVVMFCTGGIRCEKAGPFMQRLGFEDIHQLDGGILKYFEECGAAHYQGECFVFDERVGVNAELKPTGAVLCGNCQLPLTMEDQKHPHFVVDSSCPYCFAPASGRTA